MRWRAGVLGGGFAVEEPSGWETSETDLRGAQGVSRNARERSSVAHLAGLGRNRNDYIVVVVAVSGSNLTA